MEAKQKMLFFVSLARCAFGKDRELKFDTECASIVGYGESFGTVKVYSDYNDARDRAEAALDCEIRRLERDGFSLRCAPKTIDEEFHDWRRIARVGKAGKPSVCLQVIVRGLEPYFDPWIY